MGFRSVVEWNRIQTTVRTCNRTIICPPISQKILL
uniref:Uncharacterized protein n=1 Tax=Arundo donax TaxID=35708 RepID=A0A0A9E8B1_ARUDO